MGRYIAGWLAVVVTAALCFMCQAPNELVYPLTICTVSGEASTARAKPTFHGTNARLGWSDDEPELASNSVARGVRSLWTSAPFESLAIDDVTYPGRAYASPLYADGIGVTKGAARGASLSVVYVATSNGDVVALAASDAACKEGTLHAGSILWSTRVVAAGMVPRLDGRGGSAPIPGIAIGAMATPVLDLQASPPILYVTAMEAGSDPNAFRNGRSSRSMQRAVTFARAGLSRSVAKRWSRSTRTDLPISTRTHASCRNARRSRSRSRPMAIASTSGSAAITTARLAGSRPSTREHHASRRRSPARPTRSS